MAIDGWTGGVRDIKLGLAPWAIEFAFFALLLLVFVGHSPFVPPAPVALAGGTNPTGAGDVFRQLSYLALFAILAVGALQKRGLEALRAIPPLILLLLVWCMLSALWADQAAVAFRRAVLELLLVVALFLGVDSVGAERSLALWRYLLIALLIVNFVSIPLIGSAVHSGAEQDPALAGNWRGLHGHKNTAGVACVMTTILFLFSAAEKRRLLDACIALAAVAFLIMTRSKSSLGLLPIAIIAGATYRFLWQREIDRTIVSIVMILGLGMLTVLLIAESSAIARLLEDPTEFTGRATIWQAEIAYIRDHPLLGSGFGTFAESGGLSPIYKYVSGDWVNAVSHGHNGYLQLLVTVGAIGFALALAGLVLQPAYRFWRVAPETTAFRAILLALFGFLIFHNLMESDFLQDDGLAGVSLILTIAMLATLRREQAALENGHAP